MLRFVLIMIFIAGINSGLIFAQVVYPTEPDTTNKEVKKDKPAVESQDVRTDIIYQHDGTKMFVDVKKIQMNDLFYSLPSETKVNKIDQRLVHKIEYKSGKIEVLNEKPTEIRDVGDYRKVKVTYDSKDVEGLVEIAQLEARADGSDKGYSTPKSLERSAIIVLRRKAALINGDIVLVTDKRTHVAFGEIPFIIMYGKAYSYK